MGYDDQTPSQQAQSDQPFLPVVQAVILKRDSRPGKDLVSVLEAEAMLDDIPPILRIVPFVPHFPM
jgi:hypothetical protein